MDAFTSLYVWQMMYLQMRLYDENFGEKFSSYRRIFAQISIWEVKYPEISAKSINGWDVVTIILSIISSAV